MSRYSRSALLSFAVAAALGQVSTSASAQGLEEIIVTARKTEESLQSAPVAVSAFTSAAIEQKGITNLDELARFTPGLSFSQAFGRSNDRPVIRGQANVLAGVQFGVESGTAYFVDGVYWPGDIQSIDLNAMERVEVIKGPQSALYGRNTYAGAINFITKLPSQDTEATVRASVAQYGEQDFSFTVSDSFFDDRFGARLFARSYEYDGEHVNQITGRTVGDESTKSVGLNLYWRPIEDLSLIASGIYKEDDDGPLALFLQGSSANNCRPGFIGTFYRDPPPTGPVNGSRGTNPNQYYCGVIKPGAVRLNTDPMKYTDGVVRDGTIFDGVEVEEYFGTLRADWDIMGSGWTLTSLSGYRDNMNRFGTDSDHSDAFVFSGNYNPIANRSEIYPGKEASFANTNRNDIRSLSTELRLASPQDRRLRGMVGYYYFDQEDDGSDLSVFSPLGGIAEYTETITDNAYFGLVAFDITESLTLTGEIRYMEETKERSEYCSTSTSNFNFWTQTCTNRSATIGPNDPRYFSRDYGYVTYNQEGEYDSTTPRITLDWQVNDQVMVYGVYAKGAKPGGLNGTVGQSAGLPTYDQEESDNFEIGTKLDLFENRMRLNVAGYFIQATDVQFTQSVSSGSGAVTSVATNQGEGEIMGAEVELQAAITEAITLSAGYSYTDTEITKGCDADEFALNSGGVVYDPKLGTVPECDISGRRYPMGPEEAASFALNYDSPLEWGEGLSLISNFNVTYEGSKYIQVHNLAETGESTLVNLRFGVRSDNGWSIVAFGRNLTDVETIPLATRWFDIRTGSAYPGAPFAPCVPATSLVPCAAGATSPTGYPVTAAPNNPLTGSPNPGGAQTTSFTGTRAFFGALRRGRTFGIEFRYDFKL